MTEDRGLEATIGVARTSFRLEIALTVPPGRVVAVVGPNGSGKSTTLRALAGLLRPTSGRIELAGRVISDADAGIHLSSAERGAGVVFQDYLLFPHLNALDNVAFGPQAHGVPHREARARAAGWLDRLGLADFVHVRPGRLSGGQSQRVALARALVLEPPLLLLDEPLAALDASTRVEVRETLATELRAYGGSTVLITHDPVDALALADEIVVLDRGTVVQTGSPEDVATAPLNAFVAELFQQHSG